MGVALNSTIDLENKGRSEIFQEKKERNNLGKKWYRKSSIGFHSEGLDV
jgi:hypothetical protein